MFHPSWRTAIRSVTARLARAPRSRTTVPLGRDNRLEDRLAPAALLASAMRNVSPLPNTSVVRATTPEPLTLLNAPDMPGVSRLDADIAGAVLRSWRVPTGTATAQWVVGLAPGQDPQEVAGAAARVTQTPYLPDTYVVEFGTPGAVADGTNLFPGADFYYPLVAIQATKRFIPNDPLFKDEWHLRNTGQLGGTPGVDARVTSVWDKYNGTGVLIGVVDDGLDHSHPDLAPNYVAADSYDFNTPDTDPAPNAGDTHGTEVAGVAAGKGNNGIGVAGAAFNASLAGLRLIAGNFTDQDTANALSYHRDNIDIYSNSWGPPDIGTLGALAGPLTLAALKANYTAGRGGLGNIYTWAAGNGLDLDDNVNYDNMANSRYVIAVGAIDNRGNQSWYSEPGAAMLVTAYSSGNAPVGITTTTPGGGYVDDFGGTSSATPLVSGVIALMLQANPNLTARDVQNILVRTARKNDAGDAGWSTNKAGLHINHKYGFGAIDAKAAVALAEVWTLVKDEIQVQSPVVTVNKPIPDNNSTGVKSSVTLTKNIRLEHVEVVFTATHGKAEDLEVVLTAPSGTRSILAQQHFVDPFFGSFGNYNKWLFSTVRDWGEQSAGKWTLTVRDKSSGTAGTFNDWQLIVYGTEGLPPSLSGIEATTVSALEGQPAKVTGTLTVSDPNSATLSQAKVSITGNYDPSQDTLSFTASGPITGGFSSATGVLTLTGPGTVAEYQAALRSVRYLNTSDSPSKLPRTITFQVIDDTSSPSNIVSRSVTVTPVNDAPSFTAGGDVIVLEDPNPPIVTIVDWATNISAGPQEDNQTVSFETVSNSNPSLFLADPFVSPDGKLIFTPALDANGTATIQVRLTDDGGTANFGINATSAQSFLITVLPVNDAARVRDDAYTVLEDQLLSTPLPGVLGNDRDPEGHAMTAALVASPQHAGSFTFNPNGSFTYTPTANFSGDDTFTYRVTESGAGLVSATATVTLHVVPTNDVPGAVDDVAASDGHPVTINVLENDTDPDGDVLRVGSYTRPTLGQVARQGNSLVYTPRPGAVGVDTFSYTLVDAAGTTDTAVVTVNVTDTIGPEIQSVRIVSGTGGTAVADFASLGRSVLSWANITKFEMVFSEGVTVDPTALTLTGSMGGNVPLTLSYDAATRTATWTTAAALGIDRYTLQLSAAGVQDLNGNALASGWAKAFAVLPGDFDGSGFVDDADLAGIQANFSRPGLPVNRYADVNGDGRVDVNDLNTAVPNKGKSV
jgi:subtilisin-like proprotein convertase family protein